MADQVRAALHSQMAKILLRDIDRSMLEPQPTWQTMTLTSTPRPPNPHWAMWADADATFINAVTPKEFTPQIVIPYELPPKILLPRSEHPQHWPKEKESATRGQLPPLKRLSIHKAAVDLSSSLTVLRRRFQRELQHQHPSVEFWPELPEIPSPPELLALPTSKTPESWLSMWYPGQPHPFLDVVSFTPRKQQWVEYAAGVWLTEMLGEWNSIPTPAWQPLGEEREILPLQFETVIPDAGIRRADFS